MRPRQSGRRREATGAGAPGSRVMKDERQKTNTKLTGRRGDGGDGGAEKRM